MIFLHFHSFVKHIKVFLTFLVIIGTQAWANLITKPVFNNFLHGHTFYKCVVFSSLITDRCADYFYSFDNVSCHLNGIYSINMKFNLFHITWRYYASCRHTWILIAFTMKLIVSALSRQPLCNEGTMICTYGYIYFCFSKI